MTGVLRWWLHPLRTVWALVDAWSTALMIRSSEAFDRAIVASSFDVTEPPGCTPTGGVPSRPWREPDGAHDPDAA